MFYLIILFQTPTHYFEDFTVSPESRARTTTKNNQFSFIIRIVSSSH